MAKIDIKTIVTAPDEIEVPLVREDYLNTSNIFRIIFEIFLAVSCALFGVVLTLEKVSRLHWLFLLFASMFTLAFLILAYIFYIKARGKHKSS